jgi:putative membrane protein
MSPRHAASRLISLAYAGLVVGLALFTALIAYQGVREVTRTLAAAGTGLLWVTLFHLVPMLTAALGWYTILAAVTRPSLRACTEGRWIAESINELLPAMQVGGNVARARFLARAGVAGPLAGASVVVDITLHLVGQVLFTVLGLSLLLVHVRGAGVSEGVLVGIAVAAAAVTGFYLVQRRGLFGAMAGLLQRLVRSAEWSVVSSHAGAMDAWIHRLYDQRRAIFVASLWHVLSWTLCAGEVWLALRFLGHPVGLAMAIILESLGDAIRTAAFPVPGALGVQEGGFVLLGGIFGLSPELSLALSLAKRVRELLLGIPGLIVWQVQGAAAAVVARRRAARRGGA